MITRTWRAMAAAGEIPRTSAVSELLSCDSSARRRFLREARSELDGGSGKALSVVERRPQGRELLEGEAQGAALTACSAGEASVPSSCSASEIELAVGRGPW